MFRCLSVIDGGEAVQQDDGTHEVHKTSVKKFNMLKS